jgi:SAM-dependent methyltransferase
MSDKERAVVFGRDAAAYDTARPSYPADAIAHLVGLAVPLRKAIEIGPGTGKATVDIARPGLELIGLEPDAAMARMLVDKRLPGVSVEVTRYEDWDGAAGDVDLLYAAQAWHWVDVPVGYSLALRLLRPGGVLGLMWNIPENRYDQFEEVYRRHAPHILEESDERIHRRDDHDWTADMREAGLTDVGRFTTHWFRELDAIGLRTLYSTYSDHIMIEDESRTLLLEDLEATVVERGGSVIIEYRTEVFSGRA